MNEETPDQLCSDATPLLRREGGRKWNALTFTFVVLGILSVVHAFIVYPSTLYELFAFGGSSLVIAGVMFQISYPCTYRRYAPIIGLITFLIMIMVSPAFATMPLPVHVTLWSRVMVVLHILGSIISLYLIIRR